MKKVLVLVSALFAINSFASEPNLKCTVKAQNLSSRVTNIHEAVGKRLSGCRDNTGKPLLCKNASTSLNIDGSRIHINTTTDEKVYRVNITTNTGTNIDTQVPYILNLAGGDMENQFIVGDNLNEFTITCSN